MTRKFLISFPADNPLDPKHNEAFDLLILTPQHMFEYLSICLLHIMQEDPSRQKMMKERFEQTLQALLMAFGRAAPPGGKVHLGALESFTDLMTRSITIWRYEQQDNDSPDPEPGKYPTVELKNLNNSSIGKN